MTETAARLGCERGTLSRLLNGKAGVSANMALALEDIGWGTADHWIRMQASYELAQARRARAAVFSSEWQDAAHEQGEIQSFYNAFFAVRWPGNGPSPLGGGSIFKSSDFVQRHAYGSKTEQRSEDEQSKPRARAQI